MYVDSTNVIRVLLVRSRVNELVNAAQPRPLADAVHWHVEQPTHSQAAEDVHSPPDDGAGLVTQADLTDQLLAGSGEAQLQ